MRWRLYIEEYPPELLYIKGEHNVVAHALSRLEKDEGPLEDNIEAFYVLIHAFPTDTADWSKHPVSYAKLEQAQH